MTNRRPYMPLYVADFEADTRHLTAEEDGVYNRLLRAIWSAGGELPDDDVRLAQIARISIRRWNRMAATIRAFFTVVDDHIEQKRINRELQRLTRVSAARSAAGKQGGRPTEKEGVIAPPKGSRKTEKPKENGHDENQLLSGPRGRERDVRDRALLQTSDLFEKSVVPSEHTDTSRAEARSHAGVGKKPKTSKKTFVLVRDVLETALSADMAQAVIQHRNITIKKPLTPLAAQQLVDEFRKAEDAGIAPDVSAQLMIRKGWRGFEADWAIPRNRAASARSPPAAAGSPPAPEEDDYSEEAMLRYAANYEAKQNARRK